MRRNRTRECQAEESASACPPSSGRISVPLQKSSPRAASATSRMSRRRATSRSRASSARDRLAVEDVLGRPPERDRRGRAVDRHRDAATAHRLVLPAAEPRPGAACRESLMEKDPAREAGSSVAMVGARGFEPPTPRSRTVCATRLRYAPRDARTRKIARASPEGKRRSVEDGAFPAPRPRSRRRRSAVAARVAGAREAPVALERDRVDLARWDPLPEDVPPGRRASRSGSRKPPLLHEDHVGRVLVVKPRRGHGRPRGLSAGARRRRTCRTVVGIVEPPGEPTTRTGRPSFLDDRRRHRREGPRPGPHLVRAPLHEAVEVRDAGGDGEVVHLVVQEDADARDDRAVPEGAVQRRREGDGEAVGRRDRKVRRLLRLLAPADASPDAEASRAPGRSTRRASARRAGASELAERDGDAVRRRRASGSDRRRRAAPPRGAGGRRPRRGAAAAPPARPRAARGPT